MTMACFTLPLSLALLDVRYGMPFVQYALLLATPIFYTAPSAGPVAWLNQSNPFSHLVLPARDALTGASPEAGALVAPLILSSCLLALGLRYFQAKIRLAIAYIGH
jgi:ABC-type polysaccharide/polyol phosphate export permease